MSQQFHYWEFIQRNMKHYFEKYTHPCVHWNIIYNSQDLEAAMCPSVDEWTKQLWDMYTMEYYSAIKTKKILPFVTAWVDLENIMLSEISLSENGN